jgi:DNA invertase Pin-like site-specific DNA recombinase
MRAPADPKILLKRATNDELPMGALAALQELRKVLDDLEYAAIVSARSKGATASEIADVLGVTRQAVYLRMQRNDNRKVTGPPSAAPELSDAGSGRRSSESRS